MWTFSALLQSETPHDYGLFTPTTTSFPRGQGVYILPAAEMASNRPHSAFGACFGCFSLRRQGKCVNKLEKALDKTLRAQTFRPLSAASGYTLLFSSCLLLQYPRNILYTRTHDSYMHIARSPISQIS